MRTTGSIFIALLALLLAAPPAFATDAEANAKVQSAFAAERSGDFRGAAEHYAAAELLADDVLLKVNALKASIIAYRRAGLIYQEFDAIETLLTRYPSYADFVKMTDREYEIAEESYHGKREPAFWALRWVPWLLGPDRTQEIFRKALERAPFAKAAPSARLRYAFQLDADGKPQLVLEQLRALIRDYPQAPERKAAYLTLGEMLFRLSERGDGDGRYNQEAIQVFGEFRSLYPDAPENDFVDKCLLKSKDVQAKRLLGVAQFYNRTGRQDAAERYLSTVIQKYPDSQSAVASEEMLVKLDKTFTPDGYRPASPPREQIYSARELPDEYSKLLIVPENSNGKYLLPIYDLGLDRVKEKNP